MSLVIPDDILRAANMSSNELRREIAVLFFQLDKLTLGQASQYAEMSQMEFRHLLGSRHIPVHYDANEFSNDLDTLRKFGQLGDNP